LTLLLRPWPRAWCGTLPRGGFSPGSRGRPRGGARCPGRGRGRSRRRSRGRGRRRRYRGCWSWCDSGCRRWCRPTGGKHPHVIDVLFVAVHSLRVLIESGGIRDVATGGIGHNGDVIANLLVLRETSLRIKGVAHRDIGRPGNSPVRAPGIEQLRIDVIGGIARIVPHFFYESDGRHRERAKPVPLSLEAGIIINP